MEMQLGEGLIHTVSQNAVSTGKYPHVSQPLGIRLPKMLVFIIKRVDTKSYMTKTGCPINRPFRAGRGRSMTVTGGG